MNVIEQNRPEASPIPGVAHATWAAQGDGLTQLSVWRQTLSPGAATPPHSHDCDEVVLCLDGWGEVHGGGEAPSASGLGKGKELLQAIHQALPRLTTICRQ